MNQQTVESLECRAKRALNIIHKIDKLSLNVSNLGKIQYVCFRSLEDDLYFDTDRSEITFDLKKAYEKAAMEEIRLLEKELSEISFETEKATSAKVAN